jgi:hypothetical protein
LTDNPSAFFATWNVKDSWQWARDKSPGNAGKVVSRLAGRKPRGSKQRADGRRLAEAEFHDEDTIRRKNAPRIDSYCTIAIEAIPPAIERKVGIESAHLRFKRCNLLPGNIWRIRDDDIDGAFDRCSIIACNE